MGIIDLLEEIVKSWQLKIMKPVKGRERIQDGALYFHPNDVREKVLKQYQKKVQKIINP